MRFFWKMMRLWVVILFALITCYVGYHNDDDIEFNLPPLIPGYLVNPADPTNPIPQKVPVVFVFMGSLLLGATIVVLHYGFEDAKKSLTIRRLNKRIRELETQTPAISIASETSTLSDDSV